MFAGEGAVSIDSGENDFLSMFGKDSFSCCSSGLAAPEPDTSLIENRDVVPVWDGRGCDIRTHTMVSHGVPPPAKAGTSWVTVLWKDLTLFEDEARAHLLNIGSPDLTTRESG